jgi:nicotinamidase-related amidase
MTIGWVTSDDQRVPGLALRAPQAALLVIDWQERMAAAIPKEEHAAKLRNALILIKTATRLGMPIVVSEQYPKGLGPTLPAVNEALAPAGDAVRRFDKLTFSCAPAPEMAAALRATRRSHWIVCGMETHVCVFQTVRDLCDPAHDLIVHVAADACLSRRKADWKVGLGLMQQSGAIITCTETAVFDLLVKSGTPEFKDLSKLVK